MSTLLDQLRLFIEQAILSLGYAGIFLVMFLENIFPPIPSELVMPFAGSLAARGELSFTGILIAGTLGALLAGFVIYLFGLWLDEERVRGWFARYGKFALLSLADFDRASAVFTRHGPKMVLIGRFLPAIRSLISLPAGLKKMNLITFLLLTVLGTSLWNLLLASAGLLLGQNWSQVLGLVDTYEMVFWVVVSGAIVVFAASRLRQYWNLRSGQV